MKKLYFVISIFCLCLVSVSYGQNYYWYKNRKVFLQPGNKYYVVFDAEDSSAISSSPLITKGWIDSSSKQSNRMWGTVSSTDLIQSSKIRYQTSSYEVNGTDVFLTQRFYVKLKNADDFTILQNTVSNYNVTIEKEGATALWQVLRCGDGSLYNALELANIFYETGFFASCEPEFLNIVKITCVNDSLFGEQWNLRNTGQHDSLYAGIDINYCEAQSITKGKSNVIIGVYDSGVQLSHPDINVHPLSYDVDSHTSQSVINDPHGTACAGIISGKANNNLGVAGIAPLCPAMSICFSSFSAADEIAQGFNFARNNNVSVISCSWRLILQSEIVENAIDSALTFGRNGKGCVVVFSAGNDGYQWLDYPANYNPDIIVVGAVTPRGTRKMKNDGYGEDAWGSSYGNRLDVMAPGLFIPTTDITGTAGYSFNSDTTDYFMRFGGTSGACPHVSAVAGLILSVNPSLTQKEVADIIESTAQKVGSYDYEISPGRPNGTWNEQMGYGLVDAYAAVMEAVNRYPIQGPDYVCDTAKYYLLHPLQQGETVSWSVHNGVVVSPSYSIIGATNQDTVTVVKTTMGTVIRNENTIDLENILPPFPSDTIQKLKAIINGGNNSDTIIKIFRKPINGDVPTITASNNAVLWTSGTSRTFSITNCTSVPDSLLQWEIKTEIYNYLGGTPTISYSYATGRTLTYTPVIPPLKKCRIYITAINSKKECPPNSTTLSYMVNRKKSLSTMVDDDILNINISEDITDATPRLQSPKHVSGEFTLELWHAVYGRLRVKKVSNTHEQIDIRDLPKGVYVLILKDDTNIIAEEKTLIF